MSAIFERELRYSRGLAKFTSEFGFSNHGDKHLVNFYSGLLEWARENGIRLPSLFQVSDEQRNILRTEYSREGTIATIKKFRFMFGASLAEAKDWVDSNFPGYRSPQTRAQDSGSSGEGGLISPDGVWGTPTIIRTHHFDGLSDNQVKAIWIWKRGRGKLVAVKLLKVEENLGLREAVDAVELLEHYLEFMQ